MSYFIENLNYTLSNEDTLIEQKILPDNANNIFVIGGSGARVLPLLVKNPKTIYVSDVSIKQLFLVELRLQAALNLDYEDFLFFLGYRGACQDGKTGGNSRYTLFKSLSVSDPCRLFWEEKKDIWIPSGFIGLGAWESHFHKLHLIFRRYLRFNMMEIFQAQSIEEQRELYKRYFKKRLFRWFLKVFANEYVFNKYLYKGHFPSANKDSAKDKPLWKFFEDNVERTFTSTLVRKNYLSQLFFLGRIYFEEGLPLEAHRKTINQIKKSTSKVIYTQGDLKKRLRDAHWDFVSLSDVISYLPEKEANSLLQDISSQMNPLSKIVLRSFLRTPKNIDDNGFKPEPLLEEWAFKQDSTLVYSFNIYTRES